MKPGRDGLKVLTASMGGNVIHKDAIDVAKASERERFADKLCDGRAGIDRSAVLEKLLNLTADATEKPAAAKAKRAPTVEAYPIRHGGGPLHRL